MSRIGLILLLCAVVACGGGGGSAPAAAPKPPASGGAGAASGGSAGAPAAGQPASKPAAGAPESPAASGPYLAQPGAAPINVKVATCAVTGGFVHLYTGVDANLFARYGLNVEHILIRGSGPALAAMSAGEIQLLYCAAEATIPGLASGSDARIVAAPLLGLPYVLIARPEVRSVPDLRGKSIAISRPGQLNDRLARMAVEKFGMRPNADVEIRPIGGGQPEGLQAVLTGLAHSSPVTAPLDAYAKKEGMNVIYDFDQLGLPFVYSALHASNRVIRDNPQLVQRFVAGLAEAVQYTEKHPEASRQTLSKVLELEDPDALDAAYAAYAQKNVNRRLTVPLDALSQGIEFAREQGTQVTVRGAEDIATNQFAEDLDRSGFLQQLWGAELLPK
jgi:NitT/TauT family transport system substrate-binding protein